MDPRNMWNNIKIPYIHTLNSSDADAEGWLPVPSQNISSVLSSATLLLASLLQRQPPFSYLLTTTTLAAKNCGILSFRTGHIDPRFLLIG